MHESPKTGKGRATRDRIIAAATDLVREWGVGATTLDDVIGVARVSKSQLYHYFEGKAELMRAVVDRTKTQIIDVQKPLLDRLDTWQGIAAWLDAHVSHQVEVHAHGGCALGSLVPELAESDEYARRELACSFDEWQSYLTDGLRAMQKHGDLAGDVEPEHLAVATMASLQGGLVLAQVRREPQQLRIALDAAMAHLRRHSPSGHSKA